MKISTKWLAQYVDLPETPTAIAERESVTGIEVDEIIQPDAGLKNLVVGKITSLEKHPDSDHLKVCQVEVGETEPLQIVCGAPNVAAGQTVIVALNGARVAGNTKIKRGKFRGVESQGMICSLQEIGFDESVVPEAFKDGIYVFPAEAKLELGQSASAALGMDDTILNFDTTPNRADALGMRGAAWEVAAMYDRKPHFPQPTVQETSPQTAELLEVQIQDPALASSYRTRIVQNVQVQASPLWLQIKLWNNGIKPINNVVDVTNYILLDYGQPLHAYDFDKLGSKKLNVRLAQDGEQFAALNGNEYELTDQDIIISNDIKPIGLAGVMGGASTMIEAKTQNVVLEAGVFNPTRIRKTAQRHNLRTEASSRFEKGVDLEATAEALDMAAQMLQELAQGQVLQDQLVAIQAPLNPAEVTIQPARINHILGTEISSAEMTAIFKRLGFEVRPEDDKLCVIVPLRRWDISIEADLVEEVARIYGFDKLPSTLPVSSQTIGSYTPQQKFIRHAKQVMVELGYDEAISYSLLTQDQAEAFALEPAALTKVNWSMTHDHEYLRLNLISGLLDNLLYNVARKQNNVALFEQGRVFPKPNVETVRPQEIEYLAGVLTGEVVPASWQEAKRQVDFYDVKGDLEQLLTSMNRKGKVSFVATDQIPQLHPGQTAWVKLDEETIGFIGSLHPAYAKKNGLPVTVVFQLNLDRIMAAPAKIEVSQATPKFPAVSRDIAVAVAQEVTNAQLIKVIQENAGPDLITVHLFDIYEGNLAASHKKSMAYQLTFQNSEMTLTDTLVNKWMTDVQTALETELAAQIR
ncbi:phenylalanine--tRNA ligase subunit beta [Lactobacillus sp. DCY120]|uniref:Phenylalanine--tRNA ligase beta subunit n=1 Tax=Bombilactobacillus apium TaxID=2675299 RepID=A0A850QYJ6_9LACO|nr:phenylalanine--tRNA ligase subunit beta [Bombilactobacillus apium]NVY96914.1 phenylalanine--tRNA ligase subunit beta [Bombilactobacillus apium]